MSTKIDLRQSIYRGSLDQLSTGSNPEADNLMLSINNQIKPLFRLKANSNLIVNINTNELSDSETNFKRKAPSIGDTFFTFSSGTITFPSLNNNNITATPGSFTVNLNIPTSGYYAPVLVLIQKNGDVKLKVGSEASSIAGALNNIPRPDIETYVVGVIIARNVSGNIQNITQADVFQINDILTLNTSISDVTSAASLTSSQFTSEVIQSPVIKVTGSISSNVHGLTAGLNGQQVVLFNDTSETLFLVHNSTTESTTSNRILTPKGSDLRVNSKTSVLLFYDSSSSKWKVSSQSGTGGSGGGSGINYFSDRNAESISNFVLYNDGGSVPTDGVGGTVNITKSLNTTTPIIDTSSYRISKDPNDRQGEGFSFTTDIPLDQPVKEGEPITVQFRYRTSANFASGDVKMFVYLVGPNTVYALNGIRNDGVYTNNLGATGGSIGQFTATTNATATTTAIRVIGHIATTSALAYDIDIDEIKIGTAATLTAPIVTEWANYTPDVFDGATNRNSEFNVRVGRWRRVGNGVEVDIQLRRNASASSGAGGDFGVSLPPGLTRADIGSRQTAGAYFISTDVNFQGSTFVIENSNVIFVMSNTETTIRPYNNTNLPANSWHSLSCSVPITQFANATNIISSTQAQFQSLNAEVQRSTAQSIANNTNVLVTFPTVFSNPFGIWDSTNNRFVFTRRTKITISGTVFFAINGTGLRYLSIRKNGTTNVASQTVPPNASLQAAINVSLTTTANAGDFFELIAYQTSGGALNIDFGNFAVQEIPDLSVVGISGAPLEVLSATSAQLTPGGGDRFHSMTGNSITLSPGVWRIYGKSGFSTSGGDPGYTGVASVGLFGANGTNTNTAPATIASLPGVTVLNPHSSSDLGSDSFNGAVSGTPLFARINSQVGLIRNTQTITIFAVSFNQGITSPSIARITNLIFAERIR